MQETVLVYLDGVLEGKYPPSYTGFLEWSNHTLLRPGREYLYSEMLQRNLPVRWAFRGGPVTVVQEGRTCQIATKEAVSIRLVNFLDAWDGYPLVEGRIYDHRGFVDIFQYKKSHYSEVCWGVAWRDPNGDNS